MIYPVMLFTVHEHAVGSDFVVTLPYNLYEVAALPVEPIPVCFFFFSFFLYVRVYGR